MKDIKCKAGYYEWDIYYDGQFLFAIDDIGDCTEDEFRDIDELHDIAECAVDDFLTDNENSITAQERLKMIDVITCAWSSHYLA